MIKDVTIKNFYQRNYSYSLFLFPNFIFEFISKFNGNFRFPLIYSPEQRNPISILKYIYII
jgi:hypothetical protein